MTIGHALLPEFDQEMASTRRAIERVPSDKGSWKPHPKSFPLGHLAQLVAGMPGWLPTIFAPRSCFLRDSCRCRMQTIRKEE